MLFEFQVGILMAVTYVMAGYQSYGLQNNIDQGYYDQGQGQDYYVSTLALKFDLKVESKINET